MSARTQKWVWDRKISPSHSLLPSRTGGQLRRAHWPGCPRTWQGHGQGTREQKVQGVAQPQPQQELPKEVLTQPLRWLCPWRSHHPVNDARAPDSATPARAPTAPFRGAPGCTRLSLAALTFEHRLSSGANWKEPKPPRASHSLQVACPLPCWLGLAQRQQGPEGMLGPAPCSEDGQCRDTLSSTNSVARSLSSPFHREMRTLM